MNLKFIGGILIIVGTCIGGGILALPVGTSPDGFLLSALGASVRMGFDGCRSALCS